MTARDACSPVAAAAPPKAPGRVRRLVRVALIVLTAIVVVDAIVGENGVLALIEKRRQFAAAAHAVQRARTDNDALRETARRLRQDPSAIEAVARRDLGLIKPGEKVFIVKNAAPRR